MQVQNYEKDAQILREAMRGAGTDEDAIIQLTGTKNNKDRQGIRAAYKAAYGRDLLEDLESDLGGDLLKVVRGMYMLPVEFDVSEIYNAVKGAGTNEDTLSEIIGSRSNFRLKEIKTLYKQKYDENLEDRLRSETSSDYGRVLRKLLFLKFVFLFFYKIKKKKIKKIKKINELKIN